jgi:hypothetical protein
VKLLEEYLEVWRPRIPGAQEDRHVFLGERGAPLNHDAICARLALQQGSCDQT